MTHIQTLGGLSQAALDSTYARLVGVQPTRTTDGAVVASSHNPVDATSGNRTVTLADAASAGLLVAVSKKDASANTVTVSVAHLRDSGAGSITLVGQYEALLLTSKADGTWWPVGDHKTKAYLDAVYKTPTDNLRSLSDSTFLTGLSNAYVGSMVMAGAGIDPTGTSDSSTAMNAKLASAIAFGVQRVHIPAGTYKGTLSIPHPAQRVALKVTGDGVGHTVLLASGSSPVVTVGDADATFDAQFVSLQDLTIDGNNTATDCVKLNHTRFFKLWDAVLQNATAHNVTTVGDLPEYFASFLRVQFRLAPMNVYMDGGSAGIGANSCYFADCHFSGASNTNYNGTGVAVSVAINGGDSNVFRDCEFTAAGTAIYLHNSAVGNKIVNNQFDGPTTAVHCATVGVQRTHILDNSGTVAVVDSGTGTIWRQDNIVSAGTNPYTIQGRTANIVSALVKGASGQSTDVFQVQKSDATMLFRVDQSGNIETNATGAVTAHASSLFDNANNNSVSMTVDTGPSSATGNMGLRVRARNSGQTANLQEWQDSTGTRLAAIGPQGSVKLAVKATASLPSAATTGAGALMHDSTRNVPVFDDGSAWQPLAPQSAVDAISAGTIPYGWKSGNYYLPVGVLSNSTRVLTNGQAWAIPIVVPRSVTLDRLGVEVTAAGDASATIRLGLYGSAADGTPGSLLVDGGTVSAAAVAGVAATISQAVTPGLYFVVVVGQGATTTPTVRALSGTAPGVGSTSLTTVTQGNATGWDTASGSVTGALPTNLTLNGVASSAPTVAVRVA